MEVSNNCILKMLLGVPGQIAMMTRLARSGSGRPQLQSLQHLVSALTLGLPCPHSKPPVHCSLPPAAWIKNNTSETETSYTMAPATATSKPIVHVTLVDQYFSSENKGKIL